MNTQSQRKRLLSIVTATVILIGLLGSNAFSNIIHAVAPCGDFTVNDCATVKVNEPVITYTFDGTEGGVLDGVGAGTGFTMVMPATLLPGANYNAAALSVNGGGLVITGGAGINVNAVNNLVNNLGVGINATNATVLGGSDRVLTIETNIVNLDLSTDATNQQAGLVFGYSDDNYYKLVITRGTGISGNQIYVEFGREIAGAYSTVVSPAPGANMFRSVAVAPGAVTTKLTLVIDTAAKTAAASYKLGAAATVNLGTLTTIPQAFFNGVTLPAQPALGSMTFAGVMMTKRNSAAATMTARFADFTITRTPNNAPVGTTDSYTVDEDTVLTVPVATGVLSNDTDADGDALTAELISNPTNGDLVFSTDGSFNYTPDANYFGPDSFTYNATDSLLDSAATTVNITVNDVNDVPVANNDTYPLAEDGSLNVPPASGVFANDVNVGAGTATLVGPAPAGTFALQGDGSFSYTPVANFNGDATFQYKITGVPVESNTATVTINVSAVNDSPVVNSDSYETTLETLLQVDAANGVLDNDSDVDGDTLTATLQVQAANGVAVVATDGSFSYDPNDGFLGDDSFTYSATDGTVDVLGTVTITVNNPSVELLSNGDFETAGTSGRDADGWVGANLLTADRRLCTKPQFVYEGTCSFRFKFVGTSNFVRSISQVYKTPITVEAGDSVSFEVYVMGKNMTAGGAIKMIVKYQDGTKDAISAPIPTGTFAYQALTRTIPLTKNVKKVVLRAQYSGPVGNGGTFYVDGASLSLTQPGGSLISKPAHDGGNWLPVPAAQDMRGN